MALDNKIVFALSKFWFKNRPTETCVCPENFFLGVLTFILHRSGNLLTVLVNASYWKEHVRCLLKNAIWFYNIPKIKVKFLQKKCVHVLLQRMLVQGVNMCFISMLLSNLRGLV